MPAKTVYLETFGCQMNELDSELVRGSLLSLGYRFVDAPEGADIVLYNTCSVRDHAEQKVRSRLGELAVRKREDPSAASLVVGVLGCMAERDGTDLIRRTPVVDVLCGPGELDKLPALLDNAVRTRASLDADPPSPREGQGVGTLHPAAKSSEPSVAPSLRRFVALQGNTSRRSGTLAAAQDDLELLDLSRAISPTDHKGAAYVRITRGCNKFCTYCVVPFTRGAEVHRPPDHIVDECRRLADAGVIEVTLLGQTVNHYRFEHGAAVTLGGVTQPQKGRAYKGSHNRDAFTGERTTTFADLLRRIHDEVPAIRRLRFVTSYPRDFGDDVLEVIRDSPRICRYLHVPAQSGSNAVLGRMNRGYTVEEYLEFIERARAILHQPEIGRPLTLAGDIIAGFCGETEEDHKATIALLERVRYKNCFIFKYSPRPGTTAFERLPDDVSEDVKRRRNNELLAVQSRISDEVSRAFIGATLDVFVEGVSARERKRERPTAHSAHGAVQLTVGGASAPPSPSEEQGVGSGPRSTHDDAAHAPPQMTARTEGDLIVHFDAPANAAPDDLIGRIVPVQIHNANALTLFGGLTAP